jgi:hypothetical protein
MTDIIRLRNYRTYGPDGKSWSEFKCRDKDQVFVAIVVGVEPKVIHDESDEFDVGKEILRLAEHVRNSREPQRPAAETEVKGEPA